MSDAAFYYESNGQQLGPISAAELKAKAVSGELKPTDMVWKEGLPDWVSAGSVKGLFPEGTVMPPTRSAGNSTAGDMGRQAAQAAKEAAQESIGAIKTLLSDPVGGLGKAYEGLGPRKALPVGIVFLVTLFLVHLLTTVLGPGSSFGFVGGSSWFVAYLKSLLVLTATIGSMIGMLALIRTLSRSPATFPADVLIVGVSLMPAAAAQLLAALFASVLKPGLFMVMLSISIMIFGVTILLFLLFSGVTKIDKVSERAATLWVPTILVVAMNVSILLSYVLSQ